MYYEISKKRRNYFKFIEAKNTYIKDWYKKQYPSDEMGEKLKENLSFYDLFDALDNYKNIYEFVGIEDSLVRERLFQKLSELMECDYSVIFDQWLQSQS